MGAEPDATGEQEARGPARRRTRTRAVMLLASLHALAGTAGFAFVGHVTIQPVTLQELCLGPLVLGPVAVVVGSPFIALAWAIYRSASKKLWFAYAALSALAVAAVMGAHLLVWVPGLGA